MVDAVEERTCKYCPSICSCWVSTLTEYTKGRHQEPRCAHGLQQLSIECDDE